MFDFPFILFIVGIYVLSKLLFGPMYMKGETYKWVQACHMIRKMLLMHDDFEQNEYIMDKGATVRMTDNKQQCRTSQMGFRFCGKDVDR